jgi:dTDP-4-dehydrorhamnose reductase
MRIVIVGADGMIGNPLHASLERTGHTVLGTTRRVDEADAGRIFLDLSTSTRPSIPPADVAIFCAAMSRFADCRKFPERARQVNVTTPLAIAKDFVGRGGRVVMLSSSVVFDCQTPHIKAERAPAPRNAYGRMKAEVEAGIGALGGSIVRLTKIITARSGILADWFGALERGEIVRAFADHRFCPIKLENVFEAITAVIEQQAGGIFQLSGAEDISYADAARHLASRLGVAGNRIEGTLAVESGIPAEEVTPYTSLDTSRLSALTGYRPLPPRMVIDEVFASSFAAARAH